MKKIKNSLPILLLKNFLLLPNQEVKIELNNAMSQSVIHCASNVNNELIVATPKDQMEEIPEVSDLPRTAVVAKIKSKLTLPNGNERVTLRGLFRVELQNFSNDSEWDNILRCDYKKLEIPFFSDTEALAILRKLKELLTKYVNEGEGVSNSLLNIIKDVSDLNKLTDLIAAFLPLSFFKKLDYIEEMNPVVRGEKLIADLHFELEIIKLDQKLEQKLQKGLEESQKEFILKEKLREIEKELGKNNAKEVEIETYSKQLENFSHMSLKVKTKIQEEIKKISYTPDASPDLPNIRNYLDWMLHLPWAQYSVDEMDLEAIQKSLNKTHYGMEEAKSKILEYVAARRRNPTVDSPILCLVGPAGIGKTTFAKSIAESLHKKFYKISVGGLNDSSLLIGHKRTYIGSSPGKIVDGLRRCQTSNPLFLIDEVDKMVKDYKGDPASILLDILDKSQNKTFIDHYIEEEIDLSQILFVLTANDISSIPYELYDRLEIVSLYSYTLFEKIEIAKKYLLPEIFKEHAIHSKNIKFSDLSLKDIILFYTKEAGVRDLKRVLTSIVRKLIVLNQLENVKVNRELLEDLLGPFKYSSSLFVTNSIGVTNALAVNFQCGEVMPIEVVFLPGKERVSITGHSEQILKESVEVVLSYLKYNHDLFNYDQNLFQDCDIHIHFLDASTKKDGPSAGVSIATAILSYLKKMSVSSSIAFTGEITLNGCVRAVGGIKEKLIGAYNEGIKQVFVPKENSKDLETIPKEVLDKLEIIEVSDYKEIYKKIFI